MTSGQGIDSHEGIPTAVTQLRSVSVLNTRVDIEGSTWILLHLENILDPGFHFHHSELAFRSEFRNIFFEPAFLKLSSQSTARNKIDGLALVEKHGESEQLKLFAPVTIERTGKIGPKFMRVWSHEFAPLGHPLVDMEDAERVTEEFCRAIDKISPSIARGLLIDSLPLCSDFSRHFMRNGNVAGKLQQFNRFERASLLPTGGSKFSQVHLSGKRRQRLRVAKTRLEKLGEVSFHMAETLPDVEVAMLDFLFLENRGWKGRRNSALANNANTRQFSMEVVRELAKNENCRIFSLQLNGVMIASMVMLISGNHYIPWKITFDERYAKNSVGNLLLVHVNDMLTEQNKFGLLDSVATGDNETANRFWPDRLKLCSVALGFGENGPRFAHYIARNLSIYGIAKRRLRKIIGN